MRFTSGDGRERLWREGLVGPELDLTVGLLGLCLTVPAFPTGNLGVPV